MKALKSRFDFDMTREFEFERILKFYDRAEAAFREDDRTVITTRIDSPDQALTTLLRPILQAFKDTQVPLIKLSIKAAGPFSHTQWLTELDLDFQAAKVEFRIKSLIIPCSLRMIYQKLKSLCRLKFLHLRYVSLAQEDEQILKQIFEEQSLIVLFLGVVSMEGSIFMNALNKSTTVQTLALIWLQLEHAGHSFPVIEFCQRLPEFLSIQNLVLLPFASNASLWTSLNKGLLQATGLRDVMISGEGGCILHDSIVAGIASSICRRSVKRLRLNNASFGQRGMKALCNLLKNSCVEFLDLSGSSLSLESVKIFASSLQLMKSLQVIDLREARDELQNFWSRDILVTFLAGMRQNHYLLEVILSYTAESLDLKPHRDFYLQRNRSQRMLLENNLSVWPEVLARVASQGHNTLIYYLLKERVDVLFAASGTNEKKRSLAQIDKNPSEIKKVKLDCHQK
jgi:hypothetical protein